MIVHTTTILTYEAVDGTKFNSETECKKYENSLPKHLLWCLTRKYSAEALKEYGTWVIEKHTTTTSTEYESPGFLRAGGEYTVYDTQVSVIAYAEGELSDVVQWAIDKGHLKVLDSEHISKLKIEKV